MCIRDRIWASVISLPATVSCTIRTCSCGALDSFISAPRSKDGFLLFIIVFLVCKVKGRRESGHESTSFTKNCNIGRAKIQQRRSRQIGQSGEISMGRALPCVEQERKPRKTNGFPGLKCMHFSALAELQGLGAVPAKHPVIPSLST